jgi:hypothetical protein
VQIRKQQLHAVLHTTNQFFINQEQGKQPDVNLITNMTDSSSPGNAHMILQFMRFKYFTEYKQVVAPSQAGTQDTSNQRIQVFPGYVEGLAV